MQLRAATGTARKGGWTAAFVLSLVATACAGLALVVVLFRAFDEPPGGALALPDQHSPAASPGPSAPATPAARTENTRQARPTTSPIQPFGRATMLVEDPALRQVIEDALGDEGSSFSVVVVRSSDGRAAFVDPDRVFYAASLFKLSVLYEAGLRLSKGELFLDDRIQLSDEDLAEDLGTADELVLDDDQSLSLADALEAMVTVSDNATAVALLHLFGGGEIDATLRGLGIETTSVNTRELPTTARDVARVMDAIVAGEGLDRETHDLLLQLLARQTVRSGIPAGLDDGVVSGNKTGTWESITHDVAYVETPKGIYVIAVLSDTDRDWARIAEVSRAVYQAMAAG